MGNVLTHGIHYMHVNVKGIELMSVIVNFLNSSACFFQQLASCVERHQLLLQHPPSIFLMYSLVTFNTFRVLYRIVCFFRVRKLVCMEPHPQKVLRI